MLQNKNCVTIIDIMQELLKYTTFSHYYIQNDKKIVLSNILSDVSKNLDISKVEANKFHFFEELQLLINKFDRITYEDTHNLFSIINQIPTISYSYQPQINIIRSLMPKLSEFDNFCFLLEHEEEIKNYLIINELYFKFFNELKTKKYNKDLIEYLTLKCSATKYLSIVQTIEKDTPHLITQEFINSIALSIISTDKNYADIFFTNIVNTHSLDYYIRKTPQKIKNIFNHFSAAKMLGLSEETIFIVLKNFNKIEHRNKKTMIDYLITHAKTPVDQLSLKSLEAIHQYEQQTGNLIHPYREKFIIAYEKKKLNKILKPISHLKSVHKL